MKDQSAEGAGPFPWKAVLGMTALVATARFATLGEESPWLDEITNWQIASEHGLAPRTGSAHQATYISQAMGIALFGDTPWGLRAYAAVFATAAGFAVVAAAGRLAGATGALTAGLVYTLLPIAHYYGQDANHYAPLLVGGTLAAIGVPLTVGSSPGRWPWLLVLLGLLGGTWLFHPIGLLAAAALALVAWGWLLAHSDIVRPSALEPRTARLVYTLVGLALLLAALMAGGDRLAALWNAPAAGGRDPGADPEFWALFLASYFGAVYLYSWADILLGIAGSALALAGVAGLWRGEHTRWWAVGIMGTVALCGGTFLVISVKQYFSPRYTIGITGPLVLAVTIGAIWAWRTTAGRIVVVVAGALFLWRAGVWHATRLSGDFQPSHEAIAWIGENLPQGGVVVTRHRYSSLATRFLWTREGLPPDALVAGTHRTGSSVPIVQQIRELAQDHEVWFVSLLEDQERTAFAFSQWLDGHTEVIASFPSSAADAFVPIDWGIDVRRVVRMEPPAWPRPGNVVSDAGPETRIDPSARWEGQPALRLEPGASGVYTIPPDGEGAVGIQGVLPPLGLAVLVLSQADGTPHFFAWSNPSTSFLRETVSLRGASATTAHRLEVVALGGDEGVHILTIGPANGGARPLHRLEPLLIGEETSFAIGADGDLAPGPMPLTRSLTFPPGRTVVLLQTVYTDGLGDRLLEVMLEEGGRTSRLGRVNWLAMPRTMGRLLPPSSGEATLRLELRPQVSFHPRGAELTIGPTVILLAEEAP